MTASPTVFPASTTDAAKKKFVSMAYFGQDAAAGMAGVQ